MQDGRRAIRESGMADVRADQDDVASSSVVDRACGHCSSRISRLGRRGAYVAVDA